MKKIVQKFNQAATKFVDLPLLMFRLLLAFIFYKPALLKFEKTEIFVNQFVKRGIPIPEFNVYFTGTVEILGVFLLILGLGTRYISVMLLILILVATFTSEMKEAWYNTSFFKLHFFYIVSLILLITKGAGKLSVDYLIGKKGK